MELRVRDVARLLSVSEQTVYCWIKGGSLPVHRVGDQYRFNPVELQEWAAAEGHTVSPKLFARVGPAEELPNLHAALVRGGIYHQVPGREREEVLAAVAKLPGIPPAVDRGLLRQLLIRREALASTAIGDGIAIPHPRDPLVVRIDEPSVLLCFLEQPVDFRALDGRPVRVLFLLLSPSVRGHLQILAKLSFALHDPRLRDMLQTQASEDAILERIHGLEAQAAAAPAHRDRPGSTPPQA